MIKYIAPIFFLLFTFIACGVEKTDNVQMITKEQLLPMLGKPDVIIIDVRTNYSWDNSKVKIKGAVREESLKFGSWINKYPKDKTIVLYCA